MSRRPIALALVCVASLLACLAIPAVWANRQLLDTDNWTEASTALLASPQIRDRTAIFLVDEVYANVDVATQIRAALPPRAEVLAGPAAAALRPQAEDAVRTMLSRPRAQRLWEDANRKAHEVLLRVLDGGGEILSTGGGVVVLDLHALLEETEQRIGLGGRVGAALPADSGQVTILRSEQLTAAQDGLRLLRALPVVLVGLALLLFAAALLVAPLHRRETLRAFGVGLIAAGVAALAAGSLLGDAVVESVTRTEAGVPAAEEVWTIATSLLVQAGGATIFYGAVLLLGAWLAGPTAPAVAMRRSVAPYVRDPLLAYGAFAVLIAVVVLWWAPTPALRNPVTAIILVLLLAAGFEALRRRTAREAESADAAVGVAS
jgi:Ca2+/Na+ antiporter